MDTLDIDLIIHQLRISRFRNEIIGRDKNITKNGKIVSLDLSDLGITNLPKDLFRGLEYIEYIDLSKNKLGSVPKDSFYSQINLKVLDLSENRLTSLPQDIFERTHNLEELDLSVNKLTSLPNLKLEKLRKLILFDNPLKQLNDAKLRNLKNLVELNLRKCELENFDQSIVHLHKLRIIDLGDNNISKLIPELFQEIDLEELKLDLNKLRAIPRLPTTLRTLWLQGNKITGKALEGSFKGLSNLVYLFLNENKIENLGEVFDDLEKLEFLLLNGNKISHLQGKILRHMPNLKEIWLNSNPLPESEMYRGNEQINGLIERLDDAENLRKQVRTILNFLGKSDKVEVIMNKAVFKNKSLIKIDLSGLEIDRIDVRTFRNLRGLEEINLSKNKIFSLDSGTFNQLKELRKLDLSSNQITHLGKEVFPKKLLELNLKGNKLPKGWNRSFEDEFDLSEFLDYIDDNIRVFELLRSELGHLRYMQVVNSHYTRVYRGQLLGLDLSFCELEKLPEFIEQHEYITQLRAKGNKMTQISINFEKLELLDLRDNNLRNIDLILPNLKYLYISGNDLTEVPNLEKSRNLLEVQIGGNPITEITGSEFKKNNKLIELNLSNCKIREVDRQSFQDLTNLTHLDLSNNSIGTIDKDLLNRNKDLQYIDLTGNKLGKWGKKLETNKDILNYIQELVISEN